MLGLSALLLFAAVAQVASECPNACSAHGTCGAYDMCTCFRNWMAADCSQRICQFGLAHVDTPKGDLDASGGELSGASTIVVKNSFLYPYGTTEKFPAATDVAENILTNTAHEYRECSNKGYCDRSTGTCQCFEGYEGSACQRASCPSNADGVCSGHGQCLTISELAANDDGNVYELWDADATMGCLCDPGYEGPDCSMRQCKVGVDPLYYDNNATVRVSNFTYQIYTRSASAVVRGNYSLIFYDAYGEDWQTEAIAWDATCIDVQRALESLPNNVIPLNSVRCFKSEQTDATYGQGASGVEPIYDTGMYVKSKYTLVFARNPGKLRQLRLNTYLDGTRPTLFTSGEASPTLGWHVYPNGFIGEDVDYVSDRCFDVVVNLMPGTGTGMSAGTHYLAGLDAQETKLLKRCLGDADGDATNNVEVYNWDYGSIENPHLIKLQEATEYLPTLVVNNPDGVEDFLYDPQTQERPRTLICDRASRNSARYGQNAAGLAYCANSRAPGFFAVLYYDTAISTTNPFRLFTRAAQDYASTTSFFVYTTAGYLNLINHNAGVFTVHTDFGAKQRIESHYSNQLYMMHTTNLYDANGFYGEMSCETNPVGQNGARDCLNKNDKIIVLRNNRDTNALSTNPVYPNLYTVKKIYRERRTDVRSTAWQLEESESRRLRIILDYSMNARYDSFGRTGSVYKFYPPVVAPKEGPSTTCVNKGLCSVKMDTPRNGGYSYVGACSTRGLCNADTGLCECFAGYTKDDCSSMNNLVF